MKVFFTTYRPAERQQGESTAAASDPPLLRLFATGLDKVSSAQLSVSVQSSTESATVLASSLDSPPLLGDAALRQYDAVPTGVATEPQESSEGQGMGCCGPSNHPSATGIGGTSSRATGEVGPATEHGPVVVRIWGEVPQKTIAPGFRPAAKVWVGVRGHGEEESPVLCTKLGTGMVLKHTASIGMRCGRAGSTGTGTRSPASKR